MLDLLLLAPCKYKDMVTLHLPTFLIVYLFHSTERKQKYVLISPIWKQNMTCTTVPYHNLSINPNFDPIPFHLIPHLRFKIQLKVDLLHVCTGGGLVSTVILKYCNAAKVQDLYGRGIGFVLDLCMKGTGFI
jgi:hypothetical protein